MGSTNAGIVPVAQIASAASRDIDEAADGMSFGIHSQATNLVDLFNSSQPPLLQQLRPLGRPDLQQPWANRVAGPPLSIPHGAAARQRMRADYTPVGRFAVDPVAPSSRRSIGGLLDISPRRRLERVQDVDDPIIKGSIGAGLRVGYGNFTTIERSRVSNLQKLTGVWGAVIRVWDESQTWILILAMGAVTGWLAGFINISEQWLSDLRNGYCSAGFYLNRHFCCWLTPAPGECVDWIEWSPATGELWPWSLEYFFYVLTAIIFAVSSAVLVKNYAPYAAGSGIPEVKTILGGFVIRNFLSFWTLVVKCIGLVLAVASGLSLGKEGPLVHVACCVGNIFSNFVKKYKENEAKKRGLLSAACAAGVSVAFGAPIGGVLFSLEEVSYYFPYKTMWRSFFMAMVAAISLQLVNPFRTGKLVLFQVTYNRDWHAFELPLFILLGVLGGFYGALFIRLNVMYNSYRKTSWLKDWGIPEVAAVALFTSVVSFPFMFLRENSAEMVANLFRECSEVGVDIHGLCNDSKTIVNVASLLLAALLKILLTVMTFGIRVPAGIFLPSMAIGAVVGRALGIVVQSWQRAMPDLWIFTSCKLGIAGTECVTPGTYAMVGAAASLAGVTRMSVSLTVIMFELTGALSYVLPIMITVLVAKWVGDIYGKQGIYECLITLNGYPFLNPNEEYTHSTSAANVMTRLEDIETIATTGHTIDSLEEMLSSTKVKGFPVVTLQGSSTIGYIGRAELQFAIEKAKADGGGVGTRIGLFTDSHALDDPLLAVDFRPWVDHTPVKIHPKFPVDMLVELFKKMGLRYVLVTRNGQLLGIITKKDLLRDS
ncbi:hypothetical protein BASA50_000757 [Batrachochytrium salamandrivorans]|uniref:Chloride channel protein n=1 Tax=Batrachochytrium salamandrivorans TaxID=1357716 RepID=A0ABQ8ETM9_9FUNG|nr:hypothetical protein BASA50_000757 [Batrachochytrium salamandrivorans]